MKIPFDTEAELVAFAIECKLNLDEMAGKLKMSRRNMQRVFRAQLNQTPKQWRDRLCATRSAEEIGRGGQAKVVSLNQGFKHVSHFSKFLNRVLKASPRKHRRK